MKRAAFLIGSLLWFTFAVGFALIMWCCQTGGAGLKFPAVMFSSENISIGLIHIAGFTVAALICLAVSAGLFARGLTSEEKKNSNSSENAR